ncbi:MAG: hypothetical protein H6819_06800 [Phycisphaerales bacterium]|nr:hypothetical protein [Phycisphaerales bacterium]
MLICACLVGWGDPPGDATKPPRKKSKYVKKFPPESVRDLSREQKRTRHKSKNKLDDLRVAIVRQLECSRCKGTGKISKVVRFLGDAGVVHSREKKIECPQCMGASLHPGKKTYDLLDEFYQTADAHEKHFPFDGSMTEGFESWLVTHVANNDTVRVLNRHVADRLRRWKLDQGQVVMIGVSVARIVDATKGVYALGEVYPADEADAFLVAVHFNSPPPKLTRGSGLFVIGRYSASLKVDGYEDIRILSVQRYMGGT